MRKSKLFLSVIILIIASFGFLILNSTIDVSAYTSKMYPQLEKFTDCLEIIEKNYVEEVTPEKLIEGAIKGMTSVLDPHSTYLTKEEYKEIQISTTGSFGGLGIEIGIRDGGLTVITPIEGTPAFRAGIKPGDKIIRIEDKSTIDMSLGEAVKLMRGPKGTKVTITIFRESDKKPFDITITRAIIHIKSVKSQMLEPGYGYIKVRNFQMDTADNIKKALNNMLPLKGVILDLRYNPGGLLAQAISVSDLFLSSGKIVYTDGRRAEDRTEHIAHKEGTYTDFPIIVIINGGTASAAEIVAGALQDNKRAIILGVKSFGKASVQTIRPLSDGSALKLTVARYFTPSGRSIQATGIEPDIWVEQPTPIKKETNQDLNFIREKDLEHHLEPKEDSIMPKNNNKALQQLLKDDYQLKYALDILKTWNIFNPLKKAA
ncbi:MAG: S41 family peptidase [Deltaproteobacteria bacterium]|nr:S41 family peptidase [Deltaproteobacteria bacterium]